MRHRPLLIASSLASLLALFAGQALAARPAKTAPRLGSAGPANASADALTYEKDVRPILKAYCFDCHGGELLEGKLDLRLKRFLVKGGNSGPAITPHKPGDSLLVKRLRAGTMPPTEKKVPPEQVAVIERWIAAGAPTGRVEP